MEKASYYPKSLRAGHNGIPRTSRKSIVASVEEWKATAEQIQDDEETHEAGGEEIGRWFGRWGHGSTVGHFDTEAEAVEAAHRANLREGCVESRELAERRAEYEAQLRRDGASLQQAHKSSLVFV